MKKIIYILIAVCLYCTAFGQKQTISSVADGAWLSPTTWSPMGVPVPGDNIVINHDVTLNTDFAYASGSITIHSGGALVEDATPRNIVVAGGAFTNGGAFQISRFAATAGTVTNTNTISVTAFYNAADFTNTGIVQNVDSLQNNHVIHNSTEAWIGTVHFWNSDSLYNDGQLEMTYFLNTGNYNGAGIIKTSQFLNTGSAITQDSVIVLVDFMNTGFFHNTTNVPFLVAHDFLNCDSTYHDAVFINDGFVNIENNFTNVDTLKGTEGSFCIAVYSTNTGYIKGSVDICDVTASGPPYIDVNTGVIGPNVTSCTHSCTVGIAQESSFHENVDVYPNPFSSNITFTYNSFSAAGSSLTIYDMTGNAIINKNFGNDGIINISHELPAGVYFYMVKTIEGKIYSGKLISL